MVGGESLDFGGNFKLGGGEDFVVEGDEYDSAFFDKGPKFLHYRPDAVILTAIEFDHADIYRDLEAVKAAFRRLWRCCRPARRWSWRRTFRTRVEVAAEAPQARTTTFGSRRAGRVAASSDCAIAVAGRPSASATAVATRASCALQASRDG